MLTAWDIILIPIGLLFLVGLFVTINRYITYKERVALARLGFSLEDLTREAERMRRGSRGVLWGGVITATSGLALFLGLSTLGRGVWLLGGLLPLFVGLGMVLIYFLTLGAGGAREAPEGAEEDGDGGDSETFDTRRTGDEQPSEQFHRN
ncbi:MAG: hypothetical protein GX649_11740 [Chloroflexi bacterium]|nr:hypothetical protein [Chloroflexota bacterium]